MKRVVITGLGIVSPLGRGLSANWSGLISGTSAISKITRFDVSPFPVHIAGQVQRGVGAGLLNLDDVVSVKEQRRLDDFILYALVAATDAIEDSAWVPTTEEDRYRTGVLIGSGIGGLDAIENTAITLREESYRRVSPFFIPSCIINMASGNVSIKYGFKGPNLAVTNACATGSNAIGDAANIIMQGDADVMVAGGTEAAINPIAITGFAQARALSLSHNDTPETASRPWDKERDGFILGEGAGVVVLEEYEHAKKRGAKIYAEVRGYGLSGDGYHITSPAPDGNGAIRAMQSALRKAELEPKDIDYINAHGTSTPTGDKVEAVAVKSLFEDNLNFSMSSTKSVTGHLLGAAGSVEAIFSTLAIQNNVVPPTINLDNPDEATEGLDLVPFKAKERRVNHIMSNSFGFGGTNACLILSRL